VSLLLYCSLLLLLLLIIIVVIPLIGRPLFPFGPGNSLGVPIFVTFSLVRAMITMHLLIAVTGFSFTVCAALFAALAAACSSFAFWYFAS
jgi:hypothetical protein